MNADVMDDLAQYINVLSTNMEKAKHTQDRSFYVGHLAAAALIFKSLQQSNFEQARQQIATEKRNFGWSFLPGEEGSAAEAAFARFTKSFDDKIGESGPEVYERSREGKGRTSRVTPRGWTYTVQNTSCPECGSNEFECRTYGGSWDDADIHCAKCGRLIHRAWEAM